MGSACIAHGKSLRFAAEIVAGMSVAGQGLSLPSLTAQLTASTCSMALPAVAH